MTNANDGAYPLPPNEWHGPLPGLTKREEFAKAALQGLLSGGIASAPLPHGCTYAELMHNYCGESVRWADALIAALNATPATGDAA